MQSKKDCVSKMIEMCKDLRANGMETRFKRHLFGPIFELKSRVSSGGARVYFFVTETDEYVLVRAECKKEDKASVLLLNDVADVLDAYENGVVGLLNSQRRRNDEQERKT